MGLFSSNYNRPGPGIDKNAPQKPRFFIFFDVVKRKFWHLVKVNLMYVLFTLPTLLISYLVASLYMQRITIDGGFGDFIIRTFLAAFFTLIPIVTLGPVQAGFTYILRNYSREEHAFIWSDFKENFSKNFKQGMAITGIGILAIYLMGIAINFYSSYYNLGSIALTAFVTFSIVIFAIMHLYIYPMLVTVNLSVKNIYKNALIFSIMRLFPNILFFLLNVFITFAAFYNILLGGILYLFILPSFVGLMNNFFVDPTIRKYVINPDDINNSANEAFSSTFYKKEAENEEDEERRSLPEDI